MKEKISRKTFVQLGALLGVGAAGASVLAACGGKSGGGGSNDGPGGGGYGGQLDTGGYSEGSLGEKSDRSAEKQQVSGGQGDGRGGGDPVRTPDKKSVRRAENKQASDKQAIVRTSEVRPGTALAFEDSGGIRRCWSA